MTRARWFVILAAVAAGCSGGSEKPGALLHGPGALAVFDGVVAHDSGSLRPYLAIANERGDDLRLLDTTDNHIVTSPGLVFPLSIPSSGRPLFVAATRWADGAPDALVVIGAGSNVVELVDTWSGSPTVVATVPLPVDAEVLSLTAAAVPGGAAGEGRFLVGLSGGRLAVLDAKRTVGGSAIALTYGTTLTLGFDAISLSQGAAPNRFVYAATRDLLPGAVHGVAKISLPADLTGWSAASSVTALDALVPTVAVAVATFDSWAFPATGVPQADAWGTAVERVVAVPLASECGSSPKPVRCGLLALDPSLPWGGATLGHLVRKPATLPAITDPKPYLLPVALPAPVTGILATGRTAANLLPIVSGEGTVSTTGVAAVSAADGRVYLVDLARWKIASDTSPLVGTGRTRVSVASVVAGTSSAIGLFGLDGAAATAAIAALPARVRVTPGFTPDDAWTLTWQGTLPGLAGRAAILGRDGGGLWLSVQIGTLSPVSSASLATLGVQVGDTVEVGEIAALCPGGVELTVNALLAGDATRPGGRVQLDEPPTGACRDALSAIGAPVTSSATFRGSGLVLAGAASGHAGRPVLDLVPPFTPPPEHLVDSTQFPDRFPRLFYVTDACAAGTECAAIWTVAPLSLGFPLPTGPALGLSPALLDSAGSPVIALPSRGTAIHFTTASGLVPSGRRPIVKGTALASELPTGLALADGGANGTGPEVFTSYTSGVLMRFSTAAATGTMAVIR